MVKRPGATWVAFGAAVLAHLASLANGLVFDDLPAIVRNPALKAPFSVAAFFGTDFWGTAGTVGTYRPLPVMSFWLDWRLGGGAPWPFHLGNVLAHGLVAALLAVALRRQLGRPGAAWAAVVFALLAVDTEAVASAVGRADLWATVGCMAAWALSDVPSAARPWRRALGASVLLLLALFCKESAVAFVAWLFVTDRVLHPATAPRPWSARYLLPLGAVAIYLAVRLGCFGVHAVAISGFNNPLLGSSLTVRLWTALDLLSRAVRLVLLPFNLSPEYGAPEILPAGPGSPGAWLGLALLMALVAGAVAWRRRAPLYAAGAALFLVAFGVVSNGLWVLPTIFAERLLYLPSVGAAMMLWAGLEALWARRRAVAFAVAVPLLILNLAKNVEHDRAWRSALSLFSVAVEVSPRSARAWFNYGSALSQAGQRPDAIAAARRASELAPAWARPRAALGGFFDELGHFEAARDELRLAYQLEPNDPDVVRTVAIFFARHGNRADAHKIVDTYVKAHPSSELRTLLQDQ